MLRIAGDGKIGLDELTRRVAAVTRTKKERREYLDSAVNLRLASAIWPRLKPENRLHFARRALPLTAGISNVHLRGTWIERHAAGRILDFSRAVSNGPSLPLVISPTTLRDQLNIAVSYRMTGFSQSKIDGIMQLFIEQLESVGQDRPSGSTRIILIPEQFQPDASFQDFARLDQSAGAIVEAAVIGPGGAAVEVEHFEVDFMHSHGRADVLRAVGNHFDALAFFVRSSWRCKCAFLCCGNRCSPNAMIVQAERPVAGGNGLRHGRMGDRFAHADGRCGRPDNSCIPRSGPNLVCRRRAAARNSRPISRTQISWPLYLNS